MIIPSRLKLIKSIRFLLIVFMIGLIVSGVTAFPLESELGVANAFLQDLSSKNALTKWIDLVHKGVVETNLKYPFISYGTDWLAFAHLVIAIAFIGPIKDPVKNIWVVEFGIISCIAIFPLAFVAGSIRGIPFYWQLIDCSFGLIGGVLLGICYWKIKRLEAK